MKKTIQLVVLTLILLVGGISTSMAVIQRTQICYEGDTFTVSFMDVGFRANTMIWLYIGPTMELIDDRIDLGTNLGAYNLLGVTTKESGIYQFGHKYESGQLEVLLIVRLSVVPKIISPLALLTRGTESFEGGDTSNLFGQLVCVQEKSLIWKSKMLVLA